MSHAAFRPGVYDLMEYVRTQVDRLSDERKQALLREQGGSWARSCFGREGDRRCVADDPVPSRLLLSPMAAE